MIRLHHITINLKRGILFFVIFITCLSFKPSKNYLRISGSDTLSKLIHKCADSYPQKDNMVFVIRSDGSNIGMQELLDGTTDLAMSSRRIRIDEKIKLKTAGKNFHEVVVASDGVGVIVNRANPIKHLSFQQLNDIFSGSISNWKKLGGPDEKITLFMREPSSGTYEFFKNEVMKTTSFSSSSVIMPVNEGIVQSVEQDVSGIGFAAYPFITDSVRTLKLSLSEKDSAITLSPASVLNKTYPLSRSLYLYYLTANEEKVKPFVDFVLSPANKKLAEELKYILPK